MKSFVFSAALCAAVSLAAGAAFAQATEDNVASGGAFPLAAKAGQISGAFENAPPGATNQGRFNDKAWKYGHTFDPPANQKIWNPAKLKLMQGGKVTGGTVFYARDGKTYCEMANAGYDFIWTEMQHDAHNYQDAADMWATCPHAKAVPGARVAYTDEREEQHALDEGALVMMVPTVRSAEEAKNAAKWAFFPPLGGRSNGGGPAFTPEFWGNVPGGYRATANDNIMLVLMIETLDGLQDSEAIARTPGISAIFAASGDLGNFSGYKQGDPDYERAINIVHDAAISAHIHLCGPFAWHDRPDFTCFQNGAEAALLKRGNGSLTKGIQAELGPLANTQAKPEVGPFAAK